MKTPKLGLLVLFFAFFTQEGISLAANSIQLQTTPTYTTINKKRYVVVQKGNQVKFSTTPTPTTTLTWVFTNGDTTTGSGNGPIYITYSGKAAQGHVNDVTYTSTRSDTHNGNPITCTTTNNLTADVLVPKNVWNQENATPVVTNYIDHTDDTLVSSKIKISTKIILYLGLDGVSIGTLATTVSRDPADAFTPTSGTTSNDPTNGDGTFSSVFSTVDKSDPVDFMFTCPSGSTSISTSDSHQMLPAIWHDTFDCTIYYCPLEAGFDRTNLVTPPGITGHTYPQAFVNRTEIEGYGRIATPVGVDNYMGYDSDSGTFFYDTAARGHINGVAHTLVAKSTCAIDVTKIPITAALQTLSASVSAAFTNSNWTPADTGGAIIGEHLDLYWGEANPHSQTNTSYPAGTSFTEDPASQVILTSY